MRQVYWLRRAAIGPQAMIPISESRYHELRAARETLVDAGAFEHRYELLLGNYLDLERFCAEWSLRGEVEMDHRHERWARVIIDANRHVMNLLSAARSYADHLLQDFKHLPLAPAFKLQAKTRLSEAYDASTAYRFFSALRNHVQHRATPVHGLTHKMKNRSLTDSLVIYSSKAKLGEDSDFKHSVLEEIEEQVDLREMARAYMGAVGAVHIGLRQVVATMVDEARRSIEEAISDFVAAQQTPEPGTPGIGLTVCREIEGTLLDAQPLLLGWDDVRVLLAEKNRFSIKGG